MGNEEATTALTAAINGYKLSSQEAMDIVDQMTTLDLKFAASAGGIATALSKVASVAAQSGIELEKMEAILTITQDQTQQSADTIGNAWNNAVPLTKRLVLNNLLNCWKLLKLSWLKHGWKRRV